MDDERRTNRDVVTRSRRMGKLALFLGLAVHLLFLVSLRTQWLAPLFHESTHAPGQAADFFGIYHAGDRLLHGETIYDSADWPRGGRDARAPARVPYGYFYRYLPPTAYAAALVSAVVPPWPAYWLWVACVELLLFLFVASLGRLGLSPGVRDTLRGLSLGFSPFWLEQWMGQFTWPLALAAFVALRAGPRARSGFWAWVGAISLKQFPALFGWVYLRLGWWRPTLLAALAVVGLSLPYFLFHPEDLRHFLRVNLGPLPPRLLVGAVGMASLLRALAAKLPGGMTELALGPFTPYPATLLVAGWTLFVGGFCLWTTWLRARTDRTVELGCLWVCGFLLIFKDVWEYHAVLLLPVVALLSVSAARTARARWGTVTLAAGGVAAFPSFYPLYSEWALRPVETWPLLLLLLHYGLEVAPVLTLFVASVALTAGSSSPPSVRSTMRTTSPGPSSPT